jgi:hypothetical protein
LTNLLIFSYLSIEGSEVDNQKHSLEVIFQFPWVGDNLVYKDPNKKSLGYTIREGRTRKKKAELLKKIVS